MLVVVTLRTAVRRIARKLSPRQRFGRVGSDGGDMTTSEALAQVEEFVVLLERLQAGEVLAPEVLGTWLPIYRLAKKTSPETALALGDYISQIDWNGAIDECRRLLDVQQ